jgi:hypothetical protein
MSDITSVPSDDPPAINEVLLPKHQSAMYVPPGTFAEWERQGALIERVNNPATPAHERACYWWDELVAVATRTDGPLPRSGYLKRNGFLERHSPIVVCSIRESYARELVCKLAMALTQARLAPLVQSLTHEVDGRKVVLPLLKQAVYIAERRPSELAVNSELNDGITDLLNN